MTRRSQSGEPVPPTAGDAVTYLDAISTQPLHPAARETLLAALDQGYADPLRLHGPGRRARLLLDNARAAVAEALEVRPDEVSFTSSGTAAIHHGLLGLLLGRARTSRRLVLTAVEHSAVFAAGRWWCEHHDGAMETVPVSATGSVGLPELGEALSAPTGALAVQAANPEVGTVQPVGEAVGVAGDVPVFVDAAASAGHLPLPPGWSVAAASAHKWGGPAGVGVLLVRKGARWRPPFPVDDRSDARVAGFENVPAALAAAAALQAVVADRAGVNRRLALLTGRIRDAVAVSVPDAEVVGESSDRLPHVVSLSCLYLDGETLVRELDRLGFAVASGSACTASALEPSHVLTAMGALTHGNVRVSLTPEATEAEVERFLSVLPEVVASLRERGPR